MNELAIDVLTRVGTPRDAWEITAQLEAGWAAFNADPKWTELRTKYFVPLTTKITFMSATDYSPLK